MHRPAQIALRLLSYLGTVSRLFILERMLFGSRDGPTKITLLLACHAATGIPISGMLLTFCGVG